MSTQKSTLAEGISTSLYTNSYLKSIPSFLIGISTIITSSDSFNPNLNETSGSFENFDYPNLIKKAALDTNFYVEDNSYSENDISYQLNRITLLEKIEAFKNLKFGWDGYNGMPIDSEVIQSAKNTILKLKGIPHVFPTPRNSIQIEYENIQLDNYLEIEIFKNQKVVYIETEDGEEEYLYKNDIDINKKIKQLNVA